MQKGTDLDGQSLFAFNGILLLFRTHQALFLAKTTLCFLFLALALNARFFVKFTLFHFTKEPFLLKLTLEHANGFLNVIINNLDFQEQSPHFPAICNSPSC